MKRIAVVSARVDAATKERAAKVLEDFGLSVPDAIRLIMRRVAEEGRLPFDAEIPARTTELAIAELESGKVERFESVDALMRDLARHQ